MNHGNGQTVDGRLEYTVPLAAC